MSSTVQLQANWSPNDWPESLPEMRTIDNLLRCSICFEYFNIAVMVQECAHNYCSICVRKAITYETHCPTCHMKAAQQDLKCNRVLDELVKNFVNVREKLLELIRLGNDKKSQKHLVKAEELSGQHVNATPVCKSRKMTEKSTSKYWRDKAKSPRETPNRKRKRRKILESDDEVVEMEESQIYIKQEPEVMIVDQEKNSPEIKIQSAKKDISFSKPPDIAECPVCGELIPNSKINFHLDICLTREEKKELLRSMLPISAKNKTPDPKEVKSSNKNGQPFSFPSTTSTSPPSTSSQGEAAIQIHGSNTFIASVQKRKLLPKLVYTLLSDKQLKKKLKEWNLSTQGARQTMEKRHREFVMLYNSQCDSTNPKSAGTIVKEMEQNERACSKLSSASSTDSGLQCTKKSSKEDVELACKQYLKKNQGDFDKLIKDIRSRRTKQQGTASVTVEGQEAATISKGISSGELTCSKAEEISLVTEMETGTLMEETISDGGMNIDKDISEGSTCMLESPGEEGESSANNQEDFNKSQTNTSINIDLPHKTNLEKSDEENSPEINEDKGTILNRCHSEDTPNVPVAGAVAARGTNVTGSESTRNLTTITDPPSSPSTSSTNDNEDAQLTPSLGLDSSDEELGAESEDDAYSLQTSPVINISNLKNSKN